ncbi:hypothetical protein VNI00_008440 [Paramarasmius palmivorus]|uniref:Uncharacterized protein n=1 Tax=Paramarasmius palmivorus TaxID=297713 RepID=A0AAW0CTC1_9AGAR
MAPRRQAAYNLHHPIPFQLPPTQTYVPFQSTIGTSLDPGSQYQTASTQLSASRNLPVPTTDSPITQPIHSSIVQSQASIEQATKDETRTLKLAREPVLRYSLSEASAQDPNSKSISFAQDVDRLGRTWCDQYEHFDPAACHVKIQGHGIAIKYWSTVYRLDTTLRKQVNEWQWVAERYIQSSPEDFWEEFSVESEPGTRTRMNWKQITDRLRKDRIADDKAKGVGFRQRRRCSKLK